MSLRALVTAFFLVDRLSKPLLMARGTENGALPPGDLDGFLAEIEKRGAVRPGAGSALSCGANGLRKKENGQTEWPDPRAS